MYSLQSTSPESVLVDLIALIQNVAEAERKHNSLLHQFRRAQLWTADKESIHSSNEYENNILQALSQNFNSAVNKNGKQLDVILTRKRKFVLKAQEATTFSSKYVIILLLEQP